MTIHWQDQNGEIIGETGKAISLKTMPPARVSLFTIKLPAAPTNPGWYRLQFEAPDLSHKADGTNTLLNSTLVQVVANDYKVEFMNASLPR